MSYEEEDTYERITKELDPETLRTGLGFGF